MNYKHFYSSEDFFEKEKERVFTSDPIFTGIKKNELQDRDVLNFKHDRSYMICRNEDEISVFLNVCPHMGTELVEDKMRCSSKNKLACHYHCWIFDTRNGNLLHTPGYEGNEGRGLYKIDFKIWNDFIFIIPKDWSGNFDDWIYSLDNALKENNYNLKETKNIVVWEEIVDANWKLVVENNEDFYHIKYNHKDFYKLSSVKSSEADDFFYAEYIFKKDFKTHSLNPKELLNKTLVDKLYSFETLFFPNIFLTASTDHFMVQSANPIDANKTKIINKLYVHEELVEEEQIEKIEAIVGFFKKLLKEDLDLVKKQSRGLMEFKQQKIFLEEYDNWRKIFENKIINLIERKKANEC
jgi:phenylpropionate dioxygenase-like ring-hydroxylating dioxygenase large terminal subunit